MHIRQQIRNRVTAVVDAIPALTGRVFESRIHTLTPADMPCALVYSESEAVEQATKASQPTIQKRTIETAVYAFARSSPLIENSLDDLSEQIEKAIFADPTLQGLVSSTFLQNTALHIDGEPNAPIGAARLSFISTVHTREGIPQTPIK